MVQAHPDEAVIEVDCAGLGMLAAVWRLDLQAGRCMCRPAVESERSAIVARRRAHRHQARPPNIAASRVRIRTSGNLEPGTIVRDDETRPLVTSTIEPAILRRSALVAAFVGPVLTLVNQTEAVFGQRPLETGRALLTLIVPFLVASASGAMASRPPSSYSWTLPPAFRAPPRPLRVFQQPASHNPDDTARRTAYIHRPRGRSKTAAAARPRRPP